MNFEEISLYYIYIYIFDSGNFCFVIMDFNGNKRVFNRLGPSVDNRNQKVCYHWRAGRCYKNPCPYLHRELPLPHQQQPPPMSNGAASSKRSLGFSEDQNLPRRNPNFNSSSSWGRVQGGGVGSRVVRKQEKVCNFWVNGKCHFGDGCKYLHSWSTGSCFSLLTKLEGHQKVIDICLKSHCYV